MTRAKVAKEIAAFLGGSEGKWDWDDFMSCHLKDPELDAVRSTASGAQVPLLESPILRHGMVSIALPPGLDVIFSLPDILPARYKSRDPGGPEMAAFEVTFNGGF